MTVISLYVIQIVKYLVITPIIILILFCKFLNNYFYLDDELTPQYSMF